MKADKNLRGLIESAVQGSAEAFRILFEKTECDAFRFVRARVDSREDALDVLQDSYLDLWKALTTGKFTYHSDLEFMSFLYLILRRKATRLYRWLRPLSLSDSDDSSDILADETGENNPGESAIVMKAVRKLDAEDREVIRLHYFSGFTFQEIGSLLERSEGAIKARHYRAMEKLKQILGYEEQ